MGNRKVVANFKDELGPCRAVASSQPHSRLSSIALTTQSKAAAMAVNEIDQNPPDIWNNDAFRYGLLVAFLLFLVTTCYCSFNFRARRRRPFADALFISLAERARALDATGPPPDFVEAWVGPAGKPGWRDMKVRYVRLFLEEGRTLSTITHAATVRRAVF